MALVTHLRTVGQSALDFVLPPRCHGCHSRVLDDRRFCAECWGGLSLISAPSCSVCDLPFDYDPTFEGEGQTVCAACMARPPAFDKALTAARYDDASKALILRLKHARTTALAGPLGALMVARLAESGLLRTRRDWLVVPVPLHDKRYRNRRFNQSHLLAKAVVDHVGALSEGQAGAVELAPALLQRVRDTKSQGGLSRKGRKRNLTGAFIVPASEKARSKGRAVMIVDDVFTTGATVEAAATALRKAGAEFILVLCVARAPGTR